MAFRSGERLGLHDREKAESRYNACGGGSITCICVPLSRLVCSSLDGSGVFIF